jgi:hypothetical protein
MPVRRKRRGRRCGRHLGGSLRARLRLHGDGGRRPQVTGVPVERPRQGVAEVAQEMPAIADLDGPWRAAPDPVGVGAGAVACDDLDAGGWSFSHAPTVCASRSGSTSTGRLRSGSTTRVP